jgi:hypothetical protein
MYAFYMHQRPSAKFATTRGMLRGTAGTATTLSSSPIQQQSALREHGFHQLQK